MRKRFAGADIRHVSALWFVAGLLLTQGPTADAREGWQFPIRPPRFQHTALSPETGGRYGMVRTKGTQFHEAYDLVAPYNRKTKRGTPLQPVSAGTVVYAEYSNSYGNYIVVRHEGGIVSLYAHLNKIFVKVGQRVTMKTILGETGITGRGVNRYRPHLHFEMGRLIEKDATRLPNSIKSKKRGGKGHGLYDGRNIAGMEPGVFILTGWEEYEGKHSKRTNARAIDRLYRKVQKLSDRKIREVFRSDPADVKNALAVLRKADELQDLRAAIASGEVTASFRTEDGEVRGRLINKTDRKQALDISRLVLKPETSSGRSHRIALVYYRRSGRSGSRRILCELEPRETRTLSFYSVGLGLPASGGREPGPDEKLRVSPEPLPLPLVLLFRRSFVTGEEIQREVLKRIEQRRIRFGGQEASE